MIIYMNALIKTVIEPMFSIKTSVWLLGTQLLLMLVGAIAMPLQPEFETMNEGALFAWMRQTPLGVTWWLWCSVVLLGLLALNTLCCGWASLTGKARGRGMVAVLGPQVVHLGFLFMLLAHVVSSAGAERSMIGLLEGMGLELPGGVYMRLGRVDVKLAPEGYPLDWGAEIVYIKDGAVIRNDRLAPNEPSFMDGLGVYLKSVQPTQRGVAAIIELSREPGAVWALIGGVLFTIGSIMLMWHKIARER